MKAIKLIVLTVNLIFQSYCLPALAKEDITLEDSNKNISFIFIRHGESEYNVSKRLAGRADPDLTDNGINQIEELSKSLVNIDIDWIFSSDLLRAKHSAEILNESKKVEIIFSDKLREKDYGTLTGTSSERFKENIEKIPISLRFDHKFKGVNESDREVGERISRELRLISKKINDEKTILVITHSGCIRNFLAYEKLIPVEENKLGSIKNADLIFVNYKNNKFSLSED